MDVMGDIGISWIYTHTYACLYIYIYVCIYIYVMHMFFIYVYVCAYICAYIYNHIYIQIKPTHGMGLSEKGIGTVYPIGCGSKWKT